MGTDPDGELFFAYPTISWSKIGGISLGFTAGVGVPGLWSAQVGSSYNFKEKDWSASLSASYMLASSYVSYSVKGGWSTGMSYGPSQFAGLPYSNNFLSVGVNYNISNNSWSGSLSAWQVDANGWSFNPSASAAIFSERFINLYNGNGFKPNEIIPINEAEMETSKILGKWSYLDNNGNVTDIDLESLINFDDGFHAKIYKIANKYYLVFRGTENGTDWKTNILNGIGLKTTQYNIAVKLTGKIVGIVGKENLIVTGHSLGGGLAQAAAIAHNLRAITFNAASPAPVYRYNGQAAGIHNFAIGHEPLTVFNSFTMQFTSANYYYSTQPKFWQHTFIHGIVAFK